jgi:voltage-gated potassium channel
MLMGYSIIAVPTGIVTAQIIQTPGKTRITCPNCNHAQHDSDANYCKKCGRGLNQQEGE